MIDRLCLLILKATVFHSKHGSQDEMYYTDYKGEFCIGPAKNVTISKIIKSKPLPSALEDTIIE